MPGQPGIINRVVVNFATFGKMHQMRRGEQPGAVAAVAINALEHGASGAFAVGASHGENRAGKPDAVAVVHAVGHFTQAIQPQFNTLNALGVQALAMGQPLLQRHGRRIRTLGVHGRYCAGKRCLSRPAG